MTVGKPHGEKNVNEMSGHSAQPKHALRRDELRIIQMAARVPLDQFRQLLKKVLRTWSRRKGCGLAPEPFAQGGKDGRHLKPSSLESKRPQNLSALAREPLEPKWIRMYACIIISLSLSIYIYVYVHSCVPS